MQRATVTTAPVDIFVPIFLSVHKVAMIVDFYAVRCSFMSILRSIHNFIQCYVSVYRFVMLLLCVSKYNVTVLIHNIYMNWSALVCAFCKALMIPIAALQID